MSRNTLKDKLNYHGQIMFYRLLYSLAGLALGLTAIVAGCLLFLSGVSGKTTWTAKVLNLQSTLTDAAPGTILFVVGLYVVFVTRYSSSSYLCSKTAARRKAAK